MRKFFVLSTAFLCILLAGCGGHTAAGNSIALPALVGEVHGGRQPIAGATLQLYAAGTSADFSNATALLNPAVTTSDGTGLANANANAGNANNTLPAGSFTLAGQYTCPANSLVYLVAVGGNPGNSSGAVNPNSVLMAALGSCSQLAANKPNVIVNEETTVGSIAPLTGFMQSYSALGSSSADLSRLTQAFASVNDYVNTASGSAPGPSLPAGYTSPNVPLLTLADIVAGCINSTGGTAGDGSACGTLFSAATPSGGTAPRDTVAAVIDILNNPTRNVTQIFNLLAPDAPYQTPLSSAPTSWELPISSTSASHLVFTTEPGNTSDSSTFTVAVSIENGSNQVLTSATNRVTLSLTTNPSSAGLNGTLSATAVDGVAKFSNLSINSPGNGYQITATAAGITSSPSATFDISTGAGMSLAFLQQPQNVTGSISVTMKPAPTVAIEDAQGNIVTSSTAAVTISINGNSESFQQGNVTTVNAVNGVATFNGLQFNKNAMGVTFNANSPGLSSAGSDPFNVQVVNGGGGCDSCVNE